MNSKQVVSLVNKVLARLHKRLVLSESLDETAIGPTLDAMLTGYDAMGGGGGGGEDQIPASLRLGGRRKPSVARKPRKVSMSLGSRKPVVTPKSKLASFIKTLTESGVSLESAFRQASRLGVK